MKPRYLVKLVRDRVPDVLGARTGRVEYQSVDPADLHDLLKQKLLEEAAEYIIDPSLDELADLYEVIRALAATAHAATILDVAFAAGEKFHERGGFEGGLAMYADVLPEPGA